MTAKQLSVFIENRQGRLGEVLHVLKENGVNILSMSLADTTEYGILRLIVNDPEAGRDVLIDNGFSGIITEVLIIKVPHVAGALQSTLELISGKNVNIEYMYALSIDASEAYVVLKASDSAKINEILEKNGATTVGCEELSRMSGK